VSDELQTPYVGLIPYSEEHAHFFFGREAEREIITANLMASRLTVLYGASGVGKSSVLRAGVAYHLRQLAQQNRVEYGVPEFAVVVFASWRDDPLKSLKARIRDSVALTLNTNKTESPPPSLSLTEACRFWAEQVGGELFIILDQFEDYFMYHPHENGKNRFAAEFPDAVNRPDLRATFLISIREDGLAKLDLFKGRIPVLFENYLRLEHLSRDAARSAIEMPIYQYNRVQAGKRRAVRFQHALVKAVLDQVQAGQVSLGQAEYRAPALGSASPTSGSQVETPYLQLVMNRIWDAEMAAGSHTLRFKTLEGLGGAENIVRTHLDTVLKKRLTRSQRVAAARLFRHLVTPSGTKIAHSMQDLATWVGTKPSKIEPVLQELSAPGVRLLRPVAVENAQPDQAFYQIFHDVLAPAIIDWRTRYRRRRRRRLVLVLAGVTLGLAFVCLSTALSMAASDRPEFKALYLIIAGIAFVILLLLLLTGFWVGTRWRRFG